MIQFIIQLFKPTAFPNTKIILVVLGKTTLSPEHSQAKEMGSQTSFMIYHQQIIRRSFQSLASG